MSSDSHLKTNYQRGVDAETACEEYLVASGAKILAKRFKTKFGEIDLIAAKADLLLFIEVKRRKAAIFDDPISKMQKKRIMNTALQYLAENEKFSQFNMRFDCIFVDNNLALQHIEDSWRIEEI